MFRLVCAKEFITACFCFVIYLLFWILVSMQLFQLCFLILTFNLLLRCFDVTQHPRHVHAVSVHVLEKDVCIPPGQSARLIEKHQHTLGSDM